MANTQYDVNIRPASNGVIVQVGCKILVFKDADVSEVFDDLKLYFTGGFAVMEGLREKYKLNDYPELPPVVGMLRDEPNTAGCAPVR